MHTNTPKNVPSKDHLTYDIRAKFKVCYFNIDGISRDKCEKLGRLMNKEPVDAIALQ